MRLSAVNEMLFQKGSLKSSGLAFLSLALFIYTVWKYFFNLPYASAMLTLSSLAAIIILTKVIILSNTAALWLIFTAATTQSLFHVVGLPRAVPTLFTEMCVIILFIKALYLHVLIKKEKLHVFGYLPVTCLFLSMVLSSLINRVEFLPAVLCFRQTFIFFLFYIALGFNEQFSTVF